MGNKMRRTQVLAIVFVAIACSVASAQELPADYRGVLEVLARTGDFKDGVLKVTVAAVDQTGPRRR